MTLLLASNSPRRRELLARLGLPFEVRPSALYERPPGEGEAPQEYSLSLAVAKAAEVAARFPEDLVLGADTDVALGETILGKPRDERDAVRILRLLRGRTHVVATGVAVARGAEIRSGVEVARVTMREYSDREVDEYVAGGEPMDKAGAYAVQGGGGSLVARVEGCFETVVGLPLCLVESLLAEFGVIAPTAIRSRCKHVH